MAKTIKNKRAKKKVSKKNERQPKSKTKSKKAPVKIKSQLKKKVVKTLRKAPLIKLSGFERYLDFRSNGVLSKYLNRFKGMSLQDHYGSSKVINDFGEFHVISRSEEFNYSEINYTLVEQKISQDLKVLPGIAEITEQNLKKQGFRTVHDLQDSIKYKYHAEQFIGHLSTRNATELYAQLSSRFTSTNPVMLYNAAYFSREDCVFIDIETLGLHDCPLFLIGIATTEKNILTVEQIFVDHLMHEKAALQFLIDRIANRKAIISFNGKSFDVPFIRRRLERHDLNHSFDQPHFDVRNLSKSAFKDMVSDFGLQTLEDELFSYKRNEDVGGDLVPHFYEVFIRSQNIGAIVPILDHNMQDLISTAKLYNKLHEVLIN